MNAQNNTKVAEKSQKSGFTIIEVVLVLAIAALIFLMVFIALPALQRGQRDTARKNDANTVASALGTYRSNNNGALPTSSNFGTFLSQYVDGLSQYGTGIGDFDLASPAAGDAKGVADTAVSDAQVSVVLGESCKGTNSSRAAAIRVKLESGNGAVVCTDA